MSETYSLLLNAGLSNRHQRPLLRLSDDHLLYAALQVLVRTWRSCTVTDQSLLSVRVRLMMEEKKLLPCSGPINMGAWFLWTISIWRQKEAKGGRSRQASVTFLLRESGDPELQTHGVTKVSNWIQPDLHRDSLPFLVFRALLTLGVASRCLRYLLVSEKAYIAWHTFPSECQSFQVPNC